MIEFAAYSVTITEESIIAAEKCRGSIALALSWNQALKVHSEIKFLVKFSIFLHITCCFDYLSPSVMIQ